MSGRGLGALPLAALLAGCGANLLVVRHDASLRAADGSLVPVAVDYQVPDGFLQVEDMPVHTALFGLLLEPVDWLCSTAIAAQAVVRGDWSVAGGPFGWVAALTPFATLVPSLELPPPRTVEVDALGLERLRAGDLEAAREAFGARIVRLSFP